MLSITRTPPTDVEISAQLNNWKLNWCPSGNSGDYVDGFFYAADTMADFLRTDNHKIDSMSYAIMFNYRHGIELWLKKLIHMIILEKRSGHSIKNLCDELISLTNGPDYVYVDSYWREYISEICDMFNDFDPNGETFRYSEFRNGQKTTGSPLSNGPNGPSPKVVHRDINIGHMQLLMRRFYVIMEYFEETLDPCSSFYRCWGSVPR